MESAENKIVRRIHGKGRGSVVFMSDFADCGTPSAIKSAFHRLYKSGELLRLSQLCSRCHTAIICHSKVVPRSANN